jgi:putative transposase
MPRTARAARGGWCYHVINRANNRAKIFREPADYLAFLGLIVESQARLELDLFAACLMPNHFHFVVRPHADSDLSRWMHWLLTTHVRRFHGRYDSNGRVWEGRYKAFPIQQDEHLRTVIRYVERNPLRAGLVGRAQDWPWGSLGWRERNFIGPEIASCPLPLSERWAEYVNVAQTRTEIEALRLCAQKEQPYGSPEWVAEAAQALDLEMSSPGRGRPLGR